MQWTTRDAGTPTVMYGTQSGKYTSTVTGLSHTYNASTMCGEPANSTGYVAPGTFHNATITTIPATQYYYVFGDPVGPTLRVHLSFACKQAASESAAGADLAAPAQFFLHNRGCWVLKSHLLAFWPILSRSGGYTKTGAAAS